MEKKKREGYFFAVLPPRQARPARSARPGRHAAAPPPGTGRDADAAIARGETATTSCPAAESSIL
jgi:hypothetical protein